ncbi:hypothetical protein [Dietzia sp. CH92]|uniref:hypothetical protein n=1 Tax=Dietzia sp. CH92 TaxID=3051823 RepID=UPI0028D6C34F|nr:hypothetical protein [Dietzia sp. CH92]
MLTKQQLREMHDLVLVTKGAVGTYRTSGSTGEPYDFPRGPNEFADGYMSTWASRIPNGLEPFDSFVLAANTISGSGVSGYAQAKARLIRAAKDVSGNSWKVNGFLPNPSDADAAIRALKLVRPKYVVGYPSAIASIARRAAERGQSFAHLTHVILTSESVYASDVRLIEEGLSVRVLIEYGAIETGVIAGTSAGANGWPLSVLWWRTLVRTDADNEAIVTTLSNRLFPLINYGLGDRLSPTRLTEAGSVVTIGQIEGRSRDVVTVNGRDGALRIVSAREISSLVRDLPGVYSAQVAQPREGLAELLVVAPELPIDRVVRLMSDALGRNRPEFAPGSVRARLVTRHIEGARGKRSLVVPGGSIPSDSPVFDLILL